MDDNLQALNRPPLLAVTTQQTIKDYIINNELAPGDPLPSEQEMANRLGISRSVLREAVKALEALGYIESRRGSGIFVGNFSLDSLVDNLPFELLTDLDELAELTQIRRILETAMMEQVVEQISDEEIHQLRAVVDAMRLRAEKGEEFPVEDRKFHQLLLVSTGNRTLMKLTDIFWFTFNRASTIGGLANYDPVRTYKDHESIVDALAARDAATAVAALEQHYIGLGSIEFRIRSVRSRAEKIVDLSTDSDNKD